MASLCSVLEVHGAADPDHAAVAVGEETLTYGELAADVRRLAAALLDLGLEPGDRVSLYLPNCCDYVVAWFGSMRAGLIANPINPAFTHEEARYMIDDAGSRAVIVSPELYEPIKDELPAAAEHLIVACGELEAAETSVAELRAGEDRELPLPDPEAIACLPYSSGTTGRSKGIVHTHCSLSAQAFNSANHLQMRADDVLVQALPLVHLFPGNIIMGGLLTAGATMVVQPAFEPHGFVELLGSWEATACAGVPTTYAMLAQLDGGEIDAVDHHNLQIGFSAGAPLASRLRKDFERLFGAPVLDCYGITEAAGNLAANLRYLEAPELSCGVPYPQTEIRIVDERGEEVATGEVGELIARGPQIMERYWNRPDATAETLQDGWLHTGDLARCDEDGFYFIVDRLKDMILSGGYNIYPAEVEEVIQSHPAVGMCAVFSVPDDVKGEKPCAAVTAAQGQDLDVADLDAYCRDRLAAYKVPRRFVVMAEIPRSSVGKILRRKLRDQLGEQLGGELSTTTTKATEEAAG